MSSSPSPSLHVSHPMTEDLPKSSCMMEAELPTRSLRDKFPVDYDETSLSPSPPCSQRGCGARAVTDVNLEQNDVEIEKPSCMLAGKPTGILPVIDLSQSTGSSCAKPSCVMEEGLPKAGRMMNILPKNDRSNDKCSDVCSDNERSVSDVIMTSCAASSVGDVMRSVDDITGDDVVMRSDCGDDRCMVHPYFTPRQPVIRPACAYSLPNIINLNQSSTKASDEEFQEIGQRSNLDSPMYPQLPFNPFLPPHPVFNPFNPHPSVIRPTVFKPETIPRMYNPRMFYPGYLRYPAIPPPFPNMYTHHTLPHKPRKPPHPVISVQSDEEDIDVENTDPNTEEVLAPPVKVEKKVRPVGKVLRRPKSADQKCSKCDGHFLRGPELFCHIEKVHKKNKDHVCKHCLRIATDQKKRCRTISKSSNTSTTSARTESPERSSSSQEGQELCPSTPTSSTLKVKTGKKARAKKQKADPDLSLPSPKTLQNSLNKIF